MCGDVAPLDVRHAARAIKTPIHHQFVDQFVLLCHKKAFREWNFYWRNFWINLFLLDAFNQNIWVSMSCWYFFSGMQTWIYVSAYRLSIFLRWALGHGTTGAIKSSLGLKDYSLINGLVGKCQIDKWPSWYYQLDQSQSDLGHDPTWRLSPTSYAPMISCQNLRNVGIIKIINKA